MNLSELTKEEIVDLSMYRSESGISLPYDEIVLFNKEDLSILSNNGKRFTFDKEEDFEVCLAGKAKFDLYKKSIEDRSAFDIKISEIEKIMQKNQIELVNLVDRKLKDVSRDVNRYISSVDEDVNRNLKKLSEIEHIDIKRKMNDLQKILDTFKEFLKD